VRSLRAFLTNWMGFSTSKAAKNCNFRTPRDNRHGYGPNFYRFANTGGSYYVVVLSWKCNKKRRRILLRVLDLYAGVGGWSVGFKLAGFEIVKSYEWWKPAADTHRANTLSEVEVRDIRNLDLSTLPDDIDIVIGSPPCTQFSYSNRGGSGNLADGLVDIEQFLRVVAFIKPKAWAFENVPRVKSVLEREISLGGALEKYHKLFSDAQVQIFDIGDFGVPQRRKRCIAGNFDFDRLRSYSPVTADITLGQVVNRLHERVEPIYKKTQFDEIADNQPEEPLNWEEERFNRDMKTAHPVYNGMPFPDPLDRTSRTVTATCTRVSRESLVIWDDALKGYRRLSVRERSSLQSFPAGFQFLGKSHAQKLKMIGNAIPPVFTYLIGEAMKGTPVDKLTLPQNLDGNSILAKAAPVCTLPDKAGKSYPVSRRFRFSIPNLRFKSGTRFELSNIESPQNWEIAFNFGDSKRIHRRVFTLDRVNEVSERISKRVNQHLMSTSKRIDEWFQLSDLSSLQTTWSHREQGMHPFSFLDELGEFVECESRLPSWGILDVSLIRQYVHEIVFLDRASQGFAAQKIDRHIRSIAIGSVLSANVNERLQQSEQENRDGKT
jgi:DNA (cytosine-5)-methyltransferase 1